MFPRILLSSLLCGCCLSEALAHDNGVNTQATERSFDLTQQQTAQPKPEAVPSTNSASENTLTLSSQELLQHPALLHKALASSVYLQKIAQIRPLVPLYRQLPTEQRSELLLNIAEAMLAQADGQYTQAINKYRQILVEHNNLPLVRLGLAQSLFENFDNKAAADQFERLRSEPDLPPALAHLINQYLEALQKRSQWSFSGGVTYLHDNNIGNDAKPIEVNGLGKLQDRREKAQGLGYSASASRDWSLTGHWALRTGLDFNGKSFWNNHKYDELNLRPNVGVAYKTARSEIAVVPYFERRWFSNHRYSKEQGVRGEFNYWITPRHRLLFASEWGKLDYDHITRLDGHSSTHSLTWLYIRNAQQYWTLGTDWTARSAIDPEENYKRRALRLSWGQEWPKGISTSLSLNYAQRRYSSVPFIARVIGNPQLRKDKEFSAQLALWHRDIHFWGITPKLVIRWQSTRSNVPVYTYNKANTFIQLSKTF